MTGAEILDLPMDENDANAATLRCYFKALLTKIWNENEGFSGKRPFGNSGWDFEIYRALVKHDLIRGSLDEEGRLRDADYDAGNRLVLGLIGTL